MVFCECLGDGGAAAPPYRFGKRQKAANCEIKGKISHGSTESRPTVWIFLGMAPRERRPTGKDLPGERGLEAVEWSARPADLESGHGSTSLALPSWNCEF